MSPTPWIVAFFALAIFLAGFLVGVVSIAWRDARAERRLREWMRYGFRGED